MKIQGHKVCGKVFKAINTNSDLLYFKYQVFK